MTLRAADSDDRPSTNGTAKVTNGVSRIRRALLEEPLATHAGGDVVRQEVPGTCGLLHRGVAATFYGERGGGKSSVTVAIGVSAAAAGERVLYLDRENGPALTKARVEAILDAHD